MSHEPTRPMRIDDRATTYILGIVATLIAGWIVGEPLIRHADGGGGSSTGGPGEGSQTEHERMVRAKDSEADAIKAKALAYAKRQTDKYNEMGMYPRDSADFEFVLANGVVNQEALAKCGVPLDRLNRIQEVTSRIWTKMSRSMQERMVPDPDTDGGFLIPAAREAGDEILGELERELVTIVGPLAAKSLMSGLHSTNRFGWFGKLDVRVRVIPGDPESPQGSGTIVSAECFDPGSGSRITSGGGREGSEGYQRMFGLDFKPDWHLVTKPSDESPDG